MHNREPKQEEALLEYGSYAVFQLKEPFEDGNDIQHNYGIYNTSVDVCEATTSTLPQAMSIAIALDRALNETVDTLSEEEAKQEAEAPASVTLQ